MAEGVLPGQLADVGHDLSRPECVLCTSDGNLFVSDWGGGVTCIAPDGGQQRILARDPPVGIQPNGIALLEDGTFLLANLGADGGVWRLSVNGDLRPFLTEIDGQPLPPSNFVLADRLGRVWITVSTRLEPRALAYRSDVADGFIVCVDHRGARIVADGLGYTNEVQLSPDGRWLYVNETFARRLSRFAVADDGRMGQRETVCEFGPGTFPDGLAFDAEGGLWIVSIISNRVIRLAPDGSTSVWLEDADPSHLAWVEQAYENHSMGRPHLDNVVSKRLRNISSIAFGGPERRISYLGCLLSDRIVSFPSPIAGAEPAHWHWRMAQK